MNGFPLIDWNGNGSIDPRDIALSLAIAEEEAKRQEKEEASSEEDA